MTSLENTRMGRYEIRSQLGAGGMGKVYLAEDTLLQRKVAIKFLSDATTGNQQANKRLLREARAAATLDHPNICAIYEVGEENGAAFIVMQYVEGETLDARLSRKQIALVDSLTFATQIADGLAEAHAHGILHRDIKPSNIMVTPRGQTKVMDFGLAKITTEHLVSDDAETRTLLTSPGQIVGTMPYMSPEQVKGEQLDARSDIFSFGVLLYEMLTGRQPFACASAAATASAILADDPPALWRFAPNAPEELHRIVHKCLEKDRGRRYQTMQDVAVDLDNIQRRESPNKAYPASEQITEREPAASQVRPSGLRLTRLSKPVLIIGGLIVVFLVATLIYALYFRQLPVATGPEITSLAVLPLDNLSNDPAQEYFADGMTEAVIAGLGKISALRVISRTSVMQYKGVHKSLPEIARELNVDAIVEGSVQRHGDRVRITAQLIRAATDQQVWTETYERNLSDVLALQSEVAGAIARGIQIKLTPQDQARLSNALSVNSEAYDYYLRGKFYSVSINEAENKTSIELLERAVAIDPKFALGFAALGQLYTRKFSTFAPGEKVWGDKAFAAVETALLLDPDLAEAHLARGLLLWTPTFGFPHERAAQEYRRAIALNPNLDEAHHQLCVVYSHIGLLDRALQEIQTAIAINPGNLLAQYRLGTVYQYQGRQEEALAVFKKYQAAPIPAMSSYQHALALFNLGRKDEAAKVVDELSRKDPGDRDGMISSMRSMLAAAAGDFRAAEDAIGKAQQKPRGFVHFHHIAYNIACAYALMKKVEPAIEWLEKTANDGFPCYSLFEQDQNLAYLRGDQRFINFMLKQKQQWENYKSSL